MAFQFQQPLVIQTYRATRPKTTLYIPVVSGAANPATERTINTEIRRVVQQLASEQGSLEHPSSEMDGFFEVKTNEKGVLSLSIFNYAYTGGAHGMTLQSSLTFNTDTGKSYKLSELFKPGSDYVKRISSLVAAQITSRGIETFEPFKSIRPDQDFYIADRALVIYFQLYELAAYVYGFLYFPISVFDLQDIINEDGPLGPMAVNN
ncbi:DUF3298 and DUF4163 domain-containing protein [Paenibacillus sp. MMS18-CY102]|uniref:DUF3298 and DUF4163 domain-containing protein n=1 Tax=Paenibacillus sp. MMS18-CY102 TaxID=2682849 RepID=UPI0013655440|nr:DUF3298 and DUF4163 domain-containing protein [Paenibacillus sp. MMS18-CY102]MWC28220.1 DUF3298 domain-containing protein [Paenibacillus sp. MMS18-CY102]